MRKIIMTMLSASIVAGCGIYGKYERPEGCQAPSDLYGTQYSTEDTVSIASLGWRELFTDELLQGLVEKALANNTDVRKAALGVEQAELSLKTARLSYLPSLNLAPQGGVSGFNNYDGVRTGASWTYSVPVVASWEIDIFGKNTSSKRQAGEALMMAEDYRQATMTGLVASVASQYYMLLMLDEQLRITEETADKFSRSVSTLRAMKEAGMANETAIAQMEGAYWQVNAGLPSITQSIRKVENSLCSILGETPHRIERGTLSEVSFPSELKTGVPASLLERRPDVRAAEHSLAASYYAVNSARASLLPSLSLSGTAGWTNSVGTVVNPGGLLLSAAASLLQPIFNARANANRVKISRSQREEAELTFRQTVLDAGIEVNNALSMYSNALSCIESRQKQVEALRTAAEKTELLMKYSSTTYLEVLTAMQSLLSAESSLSQDRYDLISSVISLYHALGGGVR